MLTKTRIYGKNVLASTFLRSILASRSYTTGKANSEAKTNKVKENYDIIIAGGGMVGCTLACSLGKNSLFSNLKILLLEGSPQKDFIMQTQYSNRVVALNQSTKSLMKSLNIWQHVEEMRCQPVRNMQVWDACSDALITFSSSDIMDDDVAYIVENDILLHAVNKELSSSTGNNVHILYGAKIDSYDLACKGNIENVVKMKNGETYTCPLLIGADGFNSQVRKSMDVQYLSWNYDQLGVVATLELAEEGINTTAWQRFLPTGPVALLPLNSRMSSLVWSTHVDEAKKLLTLPEEQFVDALNDALWKQHQQNSAVSACMSWLRTGLRQLQLADGVARQLPPSVRRVSSRAAFPLGAGHSVRYIGKGVALVGDAAHRVHPLAGQGVNLGFGDVKDLTQNLAEALYSGLDITNETYLSKYESTRQRHNIPTQLAIEAIHRLYSADLPPLVLVRSLGLQVTNALEPIKKLIMSHAVAT